MFHKIIQVIPKDNLIVLVKFEDDINKKYDIKNILKKWPVFNELNEKEIFNNVKVDVGGCGISWNENIDLSSEEIWENGEIV